MCMILKKKKSLIDHILCDLYVIVTLFYPIHFTVFYRWPVRMEDKFYNSGKRHYHFLYGSGHWTHSFFFFFIFFFFCHYNILDDYFSVFLLFLQTVKKDKRHFLISMFIVLCGVKIVSKKSKWLTYDFGKVSFNIVIYFLPWKSESVVSAAQDQTWKWW